MISEKKNLLRKENHVCTHIHTRTRESARAHTYTHIHAHEIDSRVFHFFLTKMKISKSEE